MLHGPVSSVDGTCTFLLAQPSCLAKHFLTEIGQSHDLGLN